MPAASGLTIRALGQEKYVIKHRGIFVLIRQATDITVWPPTRPLPTWHPKPQPSTAARADKPERQPPRPADTDRTPTSGRYIFLFTRLPKRFAFTTMPRPSYADNRKGPPAKIGAHATRANEPAPPTPRAHGSPPVSHGHEPAPRKNSTQPPWRESSITQPAIANQIHIAPGVDDSPRIIPRNHAEHQPNAHSRC